MAGEWTPETAMLFVSAVIALLRALSRSGETPTSAVVWPDPEVVPPSSREAVAELLLSAAALVGKETK